jgi:hypothetical protein
MGDGQTKLRDRLKAQSLDCFGVGGERCGSSPELPSVSCISQQLTGSFLELPVILPTAWVKLASH